jgi:H+/Cl- antiporter ClcA
VQQHVEVDKKFLDQILQAAAATALGSAFRAPIGGVLFSVEVTAASYRVSNYAKGFYAAVFGATLVFLISDIDKGYRWSLSQDSDVTRTFAKFELVVFCLMGGILGVFAGFFVYCYTRIRAFNEWIKPKIFGDDWKKTSPLRAGALFCVVVAGFTAVAQYSQGEYLTRGLRGSVSDLWTEVDLREGYHDNKILRANNWGAFGSPV